MPTSVVDLDLGAIFEHDGAARPAQDEAADGQLDIRLDLEVAVRLVEDERARADVGVRADGAVLPALDRPVRVLRRGAAGGGHEGDAVEDCEGDAEEEWPGQRG